jgi:hypothetical protein
MKVRVGISKRRAKKLAAGAIAHSEDLGMWHVFLYMVIDGKVALFAEQGFDTQEEAANDVCDTLKIKPESLVEMDEQAVDDYILKNTRNQWSVKS